MNMSITHVWIVCATLTGGMIFSTGLAYAQDQESAIILYGDGVRAYFSGNSRQAEEALSRALESHSQDPRPYYFRALSLLRLGRTAEARGDMMVGAAMEAQQPNRYAVGKSLERVQGYDRLLLERFRREARADARTQRPAGGAAQASAIDDSGALRRRTVIPLDEYSRPGIGRGAPTMGTAPPTPRTFAPAAPPPAQLPAAETGDPFRDDPEPAPRP
jgi:hypothetical protein